MVSMVSLLGLMVCSVHMRAAQKPIPTMPKSPVRRCYRLLGAANPLSPHTNFQRPVVLETFDPVPFVVWRKGRNIQDSHHLGGRGYRGVYGNGNQSD